MFSLTLSGLRSLEFGRFPAIVQKLAFAFPAPWSCVLPTAGHLNVISLWSPELDRVLIKIEPLVEAFQDNLLSAAFCLKLVSQIFWFPRRAKKNTFFLKKKNCLTHRRVQPVVCRLHAALGQLQMQPPQNHEKKLQIKDVSYLRTLAIGQ